ncbi:ExbD/TolR family protein [Lignipirellula cremea]|uniref:Biopolymer transport protein ExbD n=1 Tax=Lignipirellula cremea TaxID=2528010 RepID=A0A518E2I3_9BACT|nr:biopolymer transporter ExbD [Lignipirellula cremea]QDU98273.1 biopolymer transport protein ExbD [Lignipirellula cremea]
MRRRSIFQRRPELHIEMTPMIDVVFLLLIFFVYAASDAITELVMPSQMSAAQGTAAADPNEPPPPEEDFPEIVVRITAQGTAVAWQVNGETVPTLAAMREILLPIARQKRDAPVIVHPDPEVEFGDVIDIYDLAKIVGFEKISFAAAG